PGPGHASTRIERFFTLCAEDNSQGANATTAAQYFPLLRRQVRRDVRKPLVVFTPKSILRARTSRSKVDDFVSGSFQEVLDDPAIDDPSSVRRVVLCSGKVAYDAMEARDEAAAPVAVVRVEQLYPWPEQQIADVLAKYERASEVYWLQEEPENMGPWPFVHSRLHRLLRDDFILRHVSRVESASPASGSATVHQQERAELLEQALADVLS